MTNLFRATQADEPGFPTLLEGKFPWVVDLDEEELLAVVAKLLSAEGGMPKGSSFIYDANAPIGRRRLWVSEASLHRLQEAAAEIAAHEGRHLERSE